MAISFNASSGFSAGSGFSSVTSQAFTIPSGVLRGDVVFILAVGFMSAGATTTISATGGGVSWNSLPQSFDGSSAFGTGVNVCLLWAVASVNTPGAAGNILLSAAGEVYSVGVSYTGANPLAPIDCYNRANAGTTGSTGSASCPCANAATIAANVLPVGFVGAASANNSTFTVTYPTGVATARQHMGDSFYGLAAISDNNATVAVGSSIGGGTWAWQAGENAASASYIVGLSPAAAAGTIPGTDGPRGRPRGRQFRRVQTRRIFPPPATTVAASAPLPRIRGPRIPRQTPRRRISQHRAWAAFQSPVSATRQSAFNVLSRVSASFGSAFNVRQAVSKTQASTFNVRSAVTTTQASTFNVHAAVSASQSSTFNVRQAISATKLSQWNVRAAVSATKLSTWNVRAAVSKTRQNKFNVLQRLAASKTSTFTVAQRLSASKLSQWNVRTAVIGSFTSTWNIAARINVTVLSQWNLAGPVTVTRQSLFEVRAQVSAVFTSQFEIRRPVSVAAPSVWDVRQRVSSTQVAAYNVLFRTGFTWQSVFEVLARASGDSTSTWNVASRIGVLFGSGWDVHSSIIAATFDCAFHVLFRIQGPDAVISTWNMGGRSLAAFRSYWAIRDSVQPVEHVSEWKIYPAAYRGNIPIAAQTPPGAARDAAFITQSLPSGPVTS